MLLVHGVGMNADYWGNLKAPLSAHFALTIIDMPGHGQSPLLPDPQPSLEHYTDAIATVINTPPLTPTDTPPIVVGHSMGALIALDLAVRHSPLVAGIGVLNGIYRRSRQAGDAILQRVAELKGDNKPDPTKTLERWFGDAPQGHMAKVATQCRHWLTSINQQGYAAAYSAFARADAPADEALRDIVCPALFMTGELEPNSTPAMSHAMSTLVNNSRCEVVKNARHMMSLTHAAEVNDSLVNYFKGR